jgi:hypothetical protein
MMSERVEQAFVLLLMGVAFVLCCVTVAPGIAAVW